jgi:hypothetical protein
VLVKGRVAHEIRVAHLVMRERIEFTYGKGE